MIAVEKHVTRDLSFTSRITFEEVSPGRALYFPQLVTIFRKSVWQTLASSSQLLLPKFRQTLLRPKRRMQTYVYRAVSPTCPFLISVFSVSCATPSKQACSSKIIT